MISIGVAASWTIIYLFNQRVFSSFTYTTWSNWIFLPAAMRIICVLLFEGAGVAGLVFGAFYTMQHVPRLSLLNESLLSTTSGLAPLLAVILCRCLFDIGHELRELRPLHILVLCLVGASANSFLVNGVMAFAGELHGGITSFAVIFFGDLNGAAIVLFVLSTVLAVATPRGRHSRR